MLGVSSLSMLCLLVCATLCYVSTAQGLFDCCFTYTKKPLPLRLIKGYVTQNSYEVCDMDAIIFITKKFKVCSNPKDEWVIKSITALSSKKGKKRNRKQKKPLSDTLGN